MSKPWYVRKASKLAGRSWEGMKAQWAIDAEIAMEINTRQEGQLLELHSLRLALIEAEKADHQIFVSDEIAGARIALLGDAFTYFKKSLHAFANASLASESGFCSWSIFNAYQSSFFAAKALLGIIGIGAFERGRPWFFDVFAGHRKISKSERRQNVLAEHQYRLIGIQRKNIEHRPIWHLLIHSLKISDLEDILDVGLLTEFVELSEEDFAKQRNQILYNVSSWPFDQDLVTPFKQQAFCTLSRDQASNRILEPSNSDFNNHVAVVLIYFIVTLMKDLVQVGGAVATEIEKLLAIAEMSHQKHLQKLLNHCSSLTATDA